MMFRKIKQNKRDKKCWGRCGISILYRVAREGLFDKVTFGQGYEGSEGEFGDVKPQSVHPREISCKDS